MISKPLEMSVQVPAPGAGGLGDGQWQGRGPAQQVTLHVLLLLLFMLVLVVMLEGLAMVLLVQPVWVPGALQYSYLQGGVGGGVGGEPPLDQA